MTSPLPSLGEMFPLDLVGGAIIIIAAVFIIPSIWWILSERDSRRHHK
jgi:hypothetical protein